MRKIDCNSSGLRWTGLLNEVAVSADTGILFIHGNLSSGEFWRETVEALEGSFTCLAPDLRGFGGTRGSTGSIDPIRAATAVDDWGAELAALTEVVGQESGVRRWVWVGWSMGGGIAARRAIVNGADIAGLVLVNPVAPRGFGATRGVNMELNHPDAAGSGGGCANPAFVAKLREKDRGDDPFSARGVMRSLYFADGFALAPEREDELVDAMLETRIGDDFYPGDASQSAAWPTVAPGGRGILNALSPLHCDWRQLSEAPARPPILWVRGTRDKIVSDQSLVDFGTLGQLGYVPGWPGAEVFPPQPMVEQTRAALEAYAVAGGRVETVELDCGHSPMLEAPREFRSAISRFIGGLTSE